MEQFVSRRALLGGLTAAGGALMLPGCGPSAGGGAGNAPRRGGTLRLGILEPDRTGDLDVHKPISMGSVIRGFAMYSKLWEWDDDMLPVLDLAETSEVTPDASAWTVRLKKGLEFHHGKSITADDVIFSLRRLTDPRLASPFGALINPVDRDSIRKLDERTVRIAMKPGLPFVALPETWVNFGGIVPTDYDPVHNPVGAGPFKLKDFTPGQRARFVRFENYHKPGRPYPDALEIIEFKDQFARVSALLAGQIDLANMILPEHAGLLRGKAGAQVIVSPSNTWQSFDMNVASGPFADARVREAFRLLVDRDDLVKRALQGHGRAANDLYAPQDPTFDRAIARRPYDPDKARSLLAAAGASNLSVELVTTAAAASPALVFTEQAKRVGVDIRVRKVDFSVFNGKSRPDWALSTGGTLGTPWLATALHIDAPTAVNNKTHFRDPEFSSLFQRAMGEPDLERRSALVHQAQRIQFDRGGLLIWGFTDVLDGAAARVGGIKPERSHFPTWRFDRMWVKA
ncbi:MULTISPECIES: ABC transporter substrate-binding protein [unclassified Sphingomonas]|uniref:ABC transporter substrate-binding protein n=1 Tax=unclassified Sphingomonas TaxID=196159 RepID=UPI00092633A2|nr:MULTISPECIES: ABC transporter substrate-binding protein [unclassified Sphingomonas]OJU17079.1 MAG: ABC transporter substrate-binding protein [Sphingomonas sp. 66-10]